MGGGEFWAGAGAMAPGPGKMERSEPYPGAGTYGRGVVKPGGQKKNDSPDVHIHFDVNVLVNEGEKIRIEPALIKVNPRIFK